MNFLTKRIPSLSTILWLLAVYHVYRVQRGLAAPKSVLSVLSKLSKSSLLGILVGDFIAVAIFLRLYRLLRKAKQVSLASVKNEFGSVGFRLMKSLPFFSAKIDAELRKQEQQIEKAIKPAGPRERNYELPRQGRLPDSILSEMKQMVSEEEGKWKDGFVSGAVYHGGDAHLDLLNQAAALFAVANPLHADLWPSVMKFEAEICSMTASLLNGGDREVCGCLTSGGTESIVLAVKSYRNRARERGISHPEVIACVSAHAAVEKACDLMDITLVHVPFQPESYQIDVAAVANNITEDTILIYASAPSFPQGVIDPIEELSQLAQQYDIGLHVDCCLGGFILPFAKRLNCHVPKFDFEVAGVTSMSVDTHKYGYASKGTSVILYRNKSLRRYQYFCFPKWTGGLYVTPTIPGSRPGALSAACWAAMMSLGEEGYLQAARDILDATQKIRRGIEGMQALKVLGDPKAMIVCFTARDKFNIYSLGDLMTKKGWSLNALQNPACIHICVTLRHVNKTDRFLSDLQDCIDEIHRNPAGLSKEGNAPIYGLAASLPSGPLNEVLQTYVDVVLKV